MSYNPYYLHYIARDSHGFPLYNYHPLIQGNYNINQTYRDKQPHNPLLQIQQSHLTEPTQASGLVKDGFSNSNSDTKSDTGLVLHKNILNVPISNCTGRKKALLIGINYIGLPGQLKGCINDVNNIMAFIIKNYGFREENMRVLTDDQQNNQLKLPTRQNIIDSMCWLVDNAQPNDSFFFHYSGHGSQVEDEDGDEEDGYDETIMPLDHQISGQIVDDEMNAIMVRRLPPGARLTAIFDSCHSGTALDLPYNYNHMGRLKMYHPTKIVYSTLSTLAKNYITGDVASATQAAKLGMELLVKGDYSERITQRTRGAMADVVMFSGCMDFQTSSDTHAVGYGSIGAMSHALITALSSDPNGFTYIRLLNALRSILRGRYSQLPQLSSGRPMDMNSVFVM